MRVVCVDADVLLHCEPLQNLPWQQLLPDPEIWIVILPSVAREIDHRKVNGSSAIQLKARRAAQLLRRIFSGRASTLTLRAAGPKLDVELVASVDHLNGEASAQGGNHAAERFIAEMLALGYNKSALVLLTNDTVNAIKAREAGIEARLIPEEWLHAPEPSATERAIRQLRDELRLAKPAQPRLAVSFFDRAGERITGALRLTTALMPALSDGELARCMDAIAAAHPHTPRAKSLSQSQWLRPVYGEVGRTYDQLYNDYLADCKRILSNLAELVGLTTCKGEVSLLVDNVGIVPIQDLAVDFAIAPNQWLVGASAFLNSAIDLPGCPEPGMDEIKHPDPPGRSGLDAPREGEQVRDTAPSVHWRQYLAGATHREVAATCDEFRQGGSRRFALVVELAKLAVSGTREGGRIEVKITGKNLQAPVTAALPIQVERREISRRQAIADGLIRGELAHILGETVVLG